MAVVESVIVLSVKIIGNLIIQEAKFLYEVRGRVEQLRANLIDMRLFLDDAESRKRNDRNIRNWIAGIRDIAYDAEDVLEIYALKTASRRSSSRSKVIRWFTSWRINNPKLLHEVGSAIDGLTTRLSQLSTNVETYGLKLKDLKERERPSSLSEDRQDMRASYPHTIEQNVVGLEEDASLLLDRLVHTNCRVVSICGMGGLGKTTLAKKVYRQCKVGGGHFQFFIWVFVSQQWRRRNIWETLLYELISPKETYIEEKIEKEFKKKWRKIQKMKDDAVAKLLYDELQKSKCLVVLDDVWDDDAWDKLSPGFPTEETSTKFVITTRNRNVAVKADANGFIHEPRCLNDVDSWELFKKTTTPTENIDAGTSSNRHLICMLFKLIT
ncbi:Disease resistance protein [Corchorus capsularis]|uniref:Disease resistance protein n=1 Tax=Corchorus capsularis TaxID=210143 RepID=A0A1R3KVE9_COCAP|nr:Disease resistance protein [Corchorus capsularis]